MASTIDLHDRPGGFLPKSYWMGKKLHETNHDRWMKFREELPRLLKEIGPTVQNQLAHLPNSSPPELVLAHLARDGAVVIDRAVSEQVMDTVMADMQPYLDEEKGHTEDAFVGMKTKRVAALTARSRASWDILCHPLMMDLCAGVLQFQALSTLNTQAHAGQLEHKGEQHPLGLNTFSGLKDGHHFQLYIGQVIQIHPGETAQELHRDRWALTGDLAWEASGLAPMLSSIWALSDITQEVGPTQVIPGSHKWTSDHLSGTPGHRAYLEPEIQAQIKDQIAHGTMSKGSVLLYMNGTWHGGGANLSTTGGTRDAMAVIYELGWLRHEENHYLACPPEIAQDLPVKMQKLLGYKMANSLGHYSNGNGDTQMFPSGWRGKSPTNRPVNWAGKWKKEDWAGPEDSKDLDAMAAELADLERRVAELKGEIETKSRL